MCEGVIVTPRDRRHHWWLLSFTGSKVGVTLPVVGLLVATISAVIQISHGPVRPLEVFVLVWVVLIAVAGIASARWQRKHPDGAAHRR